MGSTMSQDRRAPLLLSVRDVADALQVSIACVYAAVAEGKLACHRIGNGRGTIRIGREDLDAYLAACRIEKTWEGG